MILQCRGYNEKGVNNSLREPACQRGMGTMVCLEWEIPSSHICFLRVLGCLRFELRTLLARRCGSVPCTSDLRSNFKLKFSSCSLAKLWCFIVSCRGRKKRMLTSRGESNHRHEDGWSTQGGDVRQGTTLMKPSLRAVDDAIAHFEEDHEWQRQAARHSGI